jgi:hypothetical protein
MRSILLLGLFAAPVLMATTPALADDKAACLDAASKGQVLRDAHKLVEAREQFRVCARPQCPAMVQQDCGGWLGDVERGVPTVVLTAKDAGGADLVNVRVSVDGQPLVTRLDGQAVAVNPGTHTFLFDGPNGSRVERQALIKEGEKNQGLAVVMTLSRSSPPPPAPPVQAPAAPTEGPVSPAPSSPSPDQPSSGGGWSRGTAHTWGFVSGGVGIAGIGAGVAFGLLSVSAWSSAKSSCGGSPSQCTDVSSGQSHRSTAESDATISTVGFIAGGVLLAAGAVIFFTGHEEAESHAASLAAVPSVGPGQAGLSLIGRF